MSNREKNYDNSRVFNKYHEFGYNVDNFTGKNRTQVYGYRRKYNNIGIIRDPREKGHYRNKYLNSIQSWHDRYHGNVETDAHAFRMAKQVYDYAANKSVRVLKANFRRRRSNLRKKEYRSKFWRRTEIYENAVRQGRIPLNQAVKAVNRMKQHHINNGLTKAQAAWRSFAARDKFLDRKNKLSSAAQLSPGFQKLGAVWRSKLARVRLAKRIKYNSINPYYKGTLNNKGVALNKYITRYGRTRYKDGLNAILYKRGLAFRRYRRPTLKVL